MTQHTPHGSCYACDRPLNTANLVTCADEQTVYVGADCFQRVIDAGLNGWQPPKGGPRLWLLVYKAAPELLELVEDLTDEVERIARPEDGIGKLRHRARAALAKVGAK